MLRWGYPHYVYLFILLPVFLVGSWFYLKFRGKQFRALFDSHLILPNSLNFKMNRMKYKFLLRSLFLLFIIIALIDPQIGTRLEIVKRKGVDIILAVDVSKSMLSTDIKPSRLEKAKKEIKDLLNILEGDRIALIVFSGASFVQCPLTIDYAAMEMFTDILSPDLVPRPGTDIGSAIREAIRAFPDSTSKYKVLILMTDGEDHATKETKSAIEQAKENNIRIYTIGFGSPAGSLIPEYDEQGLMVGYKKDEKGNYITSRLNTELLQEIANETGGKFFLASSGSSELKAIYDDISKLQKQELSERQYAHFEDRFQIFLALAIIFLIWELFMHESGMKDE